jgi:hypothetical protein
VWPAAATPRPETASALRPAAGSLKAGVAGRRPPTRSGTESAPSSPQRSDRPDDRFRRLNNR